MHAATIFTVTAALVAGASAADAACCNAAGPPRGPQKCRDGTNGTPCCGYGKCNVFCCACKGGCRKPKGKLIRGLADAETGPTDDNDVFHQIDANNTGKISLEQYLAYMARPVDQTGMLTTWFHDHDANGNGFIEVVELRK